MEGIDLDPDKAACINIGSDGLIIVAVSQMSLGLCGLLVHKCLSAPEGTHFMDQRAKKGAVSIDKPATKVQSVSQ